MSPTRVSVIVVTYNSSAHMEAVHNQFASLGAGWSVVVVDNGSTDATVARARSYGMRVVDAGGNRGYGAGCNIGAAAAPADVFVFANPDVRIGSSDLGCLVGAVGSRTPLGTVGFVGPVYGPGPWASSRFSSIPRDVYGLGPRRLRPFLRFVSRGSWKDTQPLQAATCAVAVDFPVGCLMACSAIAFADVSGFDEDFFLYSEEEDLCRRGRSIGWMSGILQTVRAEHAESTSSRGQSAPSLAGVRLRSKLLYYRKHRGAGYSGIARLTIAALVGSHQVLAKARRRPSAYPAGTALRVLGLHRRGRAR